MRIILILLFILISNNSFAGKKERKAYEEYLKNFKKKALAGNHKGGEHICKGFCEGEKYFIDIVNEDTMFVVVKNNKKTQKKFFNSSKKIWVKNSWCMPVSHQTIWKDNKLKEKIYEVVSINSCGPCGNENKYSDISNSGFCPIELYKLVTVYKPAFKTKLFPKNYLPYDLKILKTFDDENNSKVLGKINVISLGNKKEFFYIKVKPKGRFVYLWSTNSYKTFLREQVIKRSNIMPLHRKGKFTKFLDSLVLRMTNLMNNEAYNSEIKLMNKFYSNLPDGVELDMIYKKFKEAKNYHIQSRE